MSAAGAGTRGPYARLHLGSFPTPVQELDLQRVVPNFRGRAWVKREDLSGAELGGNKVRKLEYLLGEAVRLGRRHVLTSGGIGSNHAVATAFYARRAGLQAHLVVFPHHASDVSSRTFSAMCGLGAQITAAPSDKAIPAVMAASYARLTSSARRPYVILPGGSQLAGVMGAVDAGAELCAQVGRGELEEPDAVFCALGSGGTAAGLACGLQIGGLRTQVAAVRVYPFPVAAVPVLARGALTRMGRRPGLDPGRVRVLTGYLGDGYAHPTQAGVAAMSAAGQLGLTLEPTYTAKAFAAFLEAAQKAPESKLVFWLTYDSRLPEDLPAPDARQVPRALRQFL